jgi:pilus assembly protein CpaD
MMRTLVRIFAFGVTGAAWLAVSACTPTESYWSEAQAPKVNKVEPVRLLHDVRFPSGTQLSSPEMAELGGFLARHDIGYGDRVYVLTETKANSVATQRTSAVVNYMAAHGIKAVDLPSPEAQPGVVRIVVNRYVVIPPNCPDWSKPGTADYSNTPMSNLGCSNIQNLGLMVADPSELIQGRAAGPADAAGSVLAIQRYRAGKITPLDKSATSESTVGGTK